MKYTWKNLLGLLMSLTLLSGCIDGVFNQDLTDYNEALAKGEFEAQITLATKIIQDSPSTINLSQAQINQAKSSYQRLLKANYQFADQQQLQDAQIVLAIAPNTELAKQANSKSAEQQKQHQMIVQLMNEFHRIETDFPSDFHRSPSHKKVMETSIGLPDFVGAIDEDYYLGAMNKQLKNQSLNDYQLQQLLVHQDKILPVALALNEQLRVLQKQGLLSASLQQTKTSLAQVINIHRQTMNHLLVSLIRNGMKAAEKAYTDISKVASSQMTHGQFDKVWEKTISPFTRKQWRHFDRTYLSQIKTLRTTILTYRAGTDIHNTVLSQTFPHAKLTYKYFWPDDDDLNAYRDQAPKRKSEAQQITKVLDSIVFDDFSEIKQSYLALAR